MASFKIVQVAENNKPYLSVVPFKWHEVLPDGKHILMWPSNVRNNSKLQRVAESEPGSMFEGWEKFECRLKRTGIPTYVEATVILERMRKCEDTTSSETENFSGMAQPSRNPKMKRGSILQEADLRDLVSTFSTKNNTKAIISFFFIRHPHRSKRLRTKKAAYGRLMQIL